MRVSLRLPLIIAVVALPAVHASAQTAPWPSDPRAGGGGMAPAPVMGGPGMGGMSPMMGMPGGPPPGGGGGPPPCMGEFNKLRDEVQKRGLAAKAAGERKVSREEMCKFITVYSTAELKWVKFVETGVSSCGIPAQVAQQLKQVHHNTEVTREKLCAAGPAIAPAAPSLSDALGTARLPTPETTKTGGGTFDTLTGNAIQR